MDHETFNIRGENWRVALTADGSRTLRLAGTDITFHSMSGAWTEAKTVFLENSGLATSMASGRGCRVLETGFGAGLNFLVTADAARSAGVSLEYVAWEQSPVPAAALEALAWDALLDHPGLVVELSSYLEQAGSKSGGDEFRFGNHSASAIRLRINIGNLLSEAARMESFDAVYHDPFSPAINPGLWTRKVFDRLFAVLRPGGTLVTWCVKASVQRDLRQAGFDVAVRRGPAGGKREVLVARRPEE
jgi:tRNA U34 5-methylaminomethyl-2-thiouridine-forming methyltransferase MnmC